MFGLDVKTRKERCARYREQPRVWRQERRAIYKEGKEVSDRVLNARKGRRGRNEFSKMGQSPIQDGHGHLSIF